MTRNFKIFGLAALVCAGAQAATISTTMTVSASGTLGGTSITATGTATLTNIGSGTFSGTVSLTPDSAGNFNAPFTITLSGGGGTITGALKIPTAALTGSGTATATITGGTGTYSGATGSFNLTGGGTLGTTLTLNFTGPGTIVTGGVAPPSITDVLDAASNTENLGQGTIFIVKGTSLSPAGYTPYNAPRPTTTADGVKITFAPAAGGTSTDAFIWYEYNLSGVNQLAGIVPSTLAPGIYNVTVTNKSVVSQPFSTTIMAHKFSIFTQDSTGSGLGSVQNYISAAQVDLNSFTTSASGNGKGTTISPAHPGQFLLAYGTGMGALVGGDNTGPAPIFDFSTNGVTVKAVVGGMTIPVAFAGRAGYFGEDQINVQLPSNVPTGCTVSFQISVNGVLSNATFIAIAPDATSTVCVQPGFTSDQLKNFDNGGSYTAGAFSLSNLSETVSGTSVTINSASGAFTKYTGNQLSGASGTTSATFTSGACTVTHTTSNNNTTTTSNGGVVLDAGVVTLNGPASSNISNRAFTKDSSNSYSMTLANSLTGGTGTITAGTYALHGAGGADIGAFDTSITVGSPLVLTGGLPTSVNRSSSLPFNWTGGNTTDIVEILGFSSSVTGTGTNQVTDNYYFVCYTTAGAKTFTVPSSILSQLPASTGTAGAGSGFLEFVSSVYPTTFTPPLVAGGKVDNGFFLSLQGIAGQVTWQ